jgi:CheY-like chemotaxis protein
MNKTTSVLLVEDDADDQYLFTKALAGISNAVLFDVVHNGCEALNRLSNAVDMPDVIFMDVHMPSMGGIECLAQLRSNHNTKHIPVIMLTTAVDLAAQARDHGATAFIEKPHDGRSLREQIEKFINLDYSTEGHIASQTFTSVRKN